MAGGATQYAGDLGVEFVFEPYCSFGEGETYHTELFAARQFEYELDLSTAESDCDGEYCYAAWDTSSVDFEHLYGSYVAAHDQACADEGGSSVMFGESDDILDAPPPGFEDFEFSLKHIDPGNGNGRQDHPVVTADCYDFSFFLDP